MEIDWERVAVIFVVTSLILIVLFTTTLMFGSIPISKIGGLNGEHTGYVTAVEHQDNLLYDSDVVYFKTDLESTQEDKYCVNDPELKRQLKEYSKAVEQITIQFYNDFVMRRRDCNGGDTIIVGIEE